MDSMSADKKFLEGLVKYVKESENPFRYDGKRLLKGRFFDRYQIAYLEDVCCDSIYILIGDDLDSYIEIIRSSDDVIYLTSVDHEEVMRIARIVERKSSDSWYESLLKSISEKLDNYLTLSK